MTDAPEPAPGAILPAPHVSKWRDPATAAAVATIAHVLIGIAAAWFMLQQLSSVLRPFFIAVILAYVLMPYHSRLRKHIGAPASIVALASLTALALFGLALAVYASVLGLSDELPRLQHRAADMTREVEELVGQAAPWAEAPSADGKPANAKLADVLTRAMTPVLTLAADALLEACIVALYLLFLLLEGSRFPDRVRHAYPHERAEAILDIAGQVSSAIISYLRRR